MAFNLLFPLIYHFITKRFINKPVDISYMDKQIAIVILSLSIALLTLISGCDNVAPAAIQSSDTNATTEIRVTNDAQNIVEETDDDAFLEKYSQFVSEWKTQTDKIIRLHVDLMMCNEGSCYVGDTKESLIQEYNERLNYNIKLVEAYKTRFESYKVSNRLENLKQRYILEMDLLKKWYEDISIKLKDGDFDKSPVDLDSWNQFSESRKISLQMEKEITEENKLSKI